MSHAIFCHFHITQEKVTQRHFDHRKYQTQHFSPILALFLARHGRGNMMFFSGAVYDGQWKFDKVTGYGTLKLPDGSIQEGTWRDGKLHGCAVFTWPHGVSEYREYDATRGLSSRKILHDCREEMAFVL